MENLEMAKNSELSVDRRNCYFKFYSRFYLGKINHSMNCAAMYQPLPTKLSIHPSIPPYSRLLPTKFTALTIIKNTPYIV